MSKLRFLCLLLTVIALAHGAIAQYVHARGNDVVDGSGKTLELRGTNLGNWLVPEGYMWRFGEGPQSYREIDALLQELIGPQRSRAFWQQYRDTYISQADIHRIKAAGFNHIRVPFHWALFQSEDAEGFRLLDRLLGWCAQEHLYVVLDMHAAPGGQTGTNIDDSSGYPWLFDDEEAQEQTIAIWKRIARHYRSNRTVMGYDLLNEPIPNYPELALLTAKLEPLQRRITSAIRTEDKRHMIVLGGAQWDQNLSMYAQPMDGNILYEVHRYKTTPGPHAIDDFLAQRDRLHAPLWMGETGENNDAWVAQMRTLLEANHVGWCFWPYKKMDADSSPVTFDRPEGWAAVVAYAKLDPHVGATKRRLPQRPQQAEIDRAVTSLLSNIRFDRERLNMGYLRALLPNTTLAPDAPSTAH